MEAFHRMAAIACGAATGLAILFGFSATSVADDAVPGQTPKPYVTFSGAHSRIENPGYYLVTSADEWTALWLRHTGNHKGNLPRGKYDFFHNPAGIPAVDFDSCMVIAVFAGKSKNSAGIQALALIDGAEQMTVRFEDKSYQTSPNFDEVTPYGFFVVRRSSKPVVLEKDVQRSKREPAVWKEVFRFPRR